jgi:hypothetical protein
VKCPSCGGSHKHSAGMRCGCGYDFVLDPKVHGFGDTRLLAVVAAVSGNGTYAFTENQLYAEHVARSVRDRRRRAWGLLAFALILAAVGIGASVAFEAPAFLLLCVFGTLIAIVQIIRLVGGRAIERESWDRAVAAARNAGRIAHLDKLIHERTLGAPPPPGPEADLLDYGVERVLVVEDDLMVDLFVRNGLHAAERCLVVAESGYPSYIAEYARRCMRERADLPIFVLHGARPGRRDPASRVARAVGIDRAELAGRAITDLGLEDADVARIKRLRAYRSGSHTDHVPADVLPMASLHTGLAACLVGGVALGTLMMQDPTSSAASVGSDFG